MGLQEEINFQVLVSKLLDELMIIKANKLLPYHKLPFQVYHSNNAQNSSANVYIGVGYMLGKWINSANFPIVLNNKQIEKKQYSTTRESSVTKFVLHARSDDICEWKKKLGSKLEFGNVLASLSLTVNDASPDSCFGLVLFVARIMGVKDCTIPKVWIDYIDGWEKGITAKKPFPIAYGELHNSLVHAKIKERIRDAWLDGLGLMLTCLKNEEVPDKIDIELNDTEIMRAGANLRYEKAAYDHARQTYRTLQLWLPLEGNADRRMLVDAAFLEERLFMGMHKMLLRSDKKHSFLKRGFTFNAIYRSDSPVGNNDLTISLDPGAGLSLKDLWLELEKEEDKLWKGERPHDDPRLDLNSYPNGKRLENGKLGNKNSPNQPWYHTPDFSLIAAPRMLANGEYGSKLKWNDILRIIWEQYNPFKYSQVIPYLFHDKQYEHEFDDKYCNLENCKPVGLNVSNKRILKLATWHQPDNSVLPLQWTPTLGRFLACCIEKDQEDTKPISAKQVFDAPAHTHLTFDSGLAVISRRGAFVLTNSIGAGLNLSAFIEVFQCCAKVMDWIGENSTPVGNLTENVDNMMAGKKLGRLSTPMKLYNEICANQLTITKLRHKYETSTDDKHAQSFRNSLLDNWGVNGRLDSLYNDLEEAKNILASHGELVTNRRIAILTFFGFPTVLAASLFSFVFEKVPNIWPLSLTRLPLLGDIHWLGLLAFIVFTIIGILLMWAFISVGDHKERIRFRSQSSSLSDLNTDHQ